ncbi:hypothetical protein RM553_17710 [Zunongwangia sp. F363]|uniref:VWFA domain-containing protein n=1 Tax=Autumnicola tepida TaxID=3075595 RepID=A0ABU3CEE8_9FLAO|nr:hypothetical protein [Zunongwangia sp. F363]MDT0644681.1 hypothetical protein [Zunongwangia sp. F363]
MKKFKLFLMGFLASAMLLVSCSKDEPVNEATEQQEVATLTFGATLNDLLNRAANTKQHFSDVPECSDAAPATVMVVLSEGGIDMDPVTINVLSDDLDSDGDMDYFTDYSEDLELMPGTYELEEFIVYDASANPIWIAPIDDDDSGEYDGYVMDALPITINLGAGVKKYVDVEVLCYDERQVNEYGYLFFDIIPNQAIEFCVFGNYCTDNGRHYPAEYSVNIWLGTDDTGTVLYTDETNSVEMDNNGDYAGTPLCFALPDTEGEDQYYMEVTLLNSDAYPDVTEEVVYSAVLTDEEVREMFDGEDAVDYYHFGINCGGGGPVISEDTHIYIYFDSSGSMNSTLSPLQEMRNTLLKQTLLPLYGNDEDAYDNQVRVISNGNERTLNFLNIEGETPVGDVIVLAFQDEAEFIYHDGSPTWDSSTGRTSTYDSDIAILRGRLSGFPANYYHGVVFQVETSTTGAYANFRKLMEYVSSSTGNYSGQYGLGDRPEVAYEYGVTPGASAQYYADLIVDALTGLGYSL